ncbi:major facilitator superfamily permease [Klebsiella variicola]|nr:major facilitator superfamily permease [Klebsiella variicola]VAR93305.1 major facilitator superfamily permease [Klebsiella variicola]
MAQTRYGEPIGEIPTWKASEAPVLPGSPSMPVLPLGIKFLCAFIAIILGITGAMGTSLITANQSLVQGAFGLDPSQGAWVSAAYASGGVAMNLVYVKFRQHFGVNAFIKTFLTGYAVVALLQVVLPYEFYALCILRFLNGVCGSATATFSVFYMLQAFPVRYLLASLVAGIGLVQVGYPLVSLVSPTLYDLGGWSMVFWLEAGMILVSLACILWLPVPRGNRIHVFEVQDIASVILLAGGLGLICVACAQGRVLWWLEAPWIGWTLILAGVSITTGFLFEYYRRHPLIDTRWILTPHFVRFIVAAVLMRMMLSEQTYGSQGLMQVVGMSAWQMQIMYAVILVSVVAGILVGAVMMLFTATAVFVMDLAAPLLLAVAAFMDSHSTVLTAPQNLYLSQAIMGFAGVLFMASCFIEIFVLLFARGVNISALITIILTFGSAQLLGGILGPAVYGTLQIYRVSYHGALLAAPLTGSDAHVMESVRMMGAPYASVLTDPTLLSAVSSSQLAQQVLQQANILAFNDVFLAICATALGYFFFSLPFVLSLAVRFRKAQPGRRN